MKKYLLIFILVFILPTIMLLGGCSGKECNCDQISCQCSDSNSCSCDLENINECNCDLSGINGCNCSLDDINSCQCSDPSFVVGEVKYSSMGSSFEFYITERENGSEKDLSITKKASITEFKFEAIKIADCNNIDDYKDNIYYRYIYRFSIAGTLPTLYAGASINPCISFSNMSSNFSVYPYGEVDTTGNFSIISAYYTNQLIEDFFLYSFVVDITNI